MWPSFFLILNQCSLIASVTRLHVISPSKLASTLSLEVTYAQQWDVGFVEEVSKKIQTHESLYFYFTLFY